MEVVVMLWWRVDVLCFLLCSLGVCGVVVMLSVERFRLAADNESCCVLSFVLFGWYCTFDFKLLSLN